MFNVNERVREILAVNEIRGGADPAKKKSTARGKKPQPTAIDGKKTEQTPPSANDSTLSNIKLEKYDQIYDFSKLVVGDYIRFVSRKDGKLKYGGVIRKISRGVDGKYSINIGRLFSGGKYVYLTVHQDNISALYRFKNELKNKKKNDTVMHDMVSSVEEAAKPQPPPRSEMLAEHILLGNESEKSNAALIKLLMNYENEIKQLKHSLACITQPPPPPPPPSSPLQ
jgi:hypothetical protein